MSGFFDDLIVIELADRRNQLVGKLLADGGARVIQIESPEGSLGRHCGPFAKDEPDPDKCLDYWFYNTGKESVQIDVNQPGGADLVARLIERADVFVESKLTHELSPLGFDYETLSKRTGGKLIQASLTDFGQTGPWRDFRANEQSHMALGGPMSTSGYSDPTVTPIGGQGHQPWNIAGTLCTHAIIAAMFEKLSTGRGQYIDCAIHDCTAISTEGGIPRWIYNNMILYRNTGQHATIGSRTPGKLNIQAADGRWVNTVSTRLTPYLWVNVLEWMKEEGVAGELEDPKYMDDDYRNFRWRQGSEINEGFGRLLAKMSAQEAMERAQSFGLTWSVIQAPEENYDMQHWQDRDFWVSLDQPGNEGPVRYMRGPFKIDGIEFQPKRPAPRLGEHTASVLRDLLGIDVAKSKLEGVV